MIDDTIVVEHIYGHNGDPWNEAVDTLAKAEARHSHFLPRLEVDLRRWKAVIPFLWMIVGERYGCPAFCGQGFDVQAPDLPPNLPAAHEDRQAKATTRSKYSAVIAVLRISLASGNVSTLGVGARGLAGKLDYLKEQFRSFNLNFLGVQETRTQEGQLCDSGLLRFCSGSDAKNLGVELWCNLRQPIGHSDGSPIYLHDKDFRVLHRDPRRLLVTIQTVVWQATILVGHAPHSGYSLSERTQWWESTSGIIQSLVPDLPLFAMIDANAAPGPCDHRVVLGPGFTTSSSTSLWRQFLTTNFACPRRVLCMLARAIPGLHLMEMTGTSLTSLPSRRQRLHNVHGHRPWTSVISILRMRTILQSDWSCPGHPLVSHRPAHL